MLPIHFHPRYQHERFSRNPSLTQLEQYILNDGGGFGDATIHHGEYPSDAYLIILFDDTLGYYIKYLDGKSEWLSLYDGSRLTEVICPDDWDASVGLFVPPPLAWLTIARFCETGERLQTQEWVMPEKCPKGRTGSACQHLVQPP